MTTLTVTTPYGVFTRKTNTPYKFVALAAHADGSPVRIVGAAASAALRHGTPTDVAYLPRWSKTAAGAVKLAQTYPYDRDLIALGPWAVDRGPASDHGLDLTRPDSGAV